MQKWAFTAALFLAAVSAGADQFLPAAAGTSWEYDSVETRTDMAPTRTVVTVRASKQLVAGRELVKLETLSNDVISKTELISVDDYGIVCLARSGKDGKLVVLNPAETMVIAPLRVGAKWDQEGEVAGVRMHQHWIVVAEENVIVPAGQFQAFHLRLDESALMSVKLDRWFVPGTGVVKEVTVVRGPGMFQRVTLELKKITEAPLKPGLSPSPAVPRRPELPNILPQPTSSISSSSTPAEAAANPDEPPAPTPTKKLTVEVSSDPAGGLKTEFKSNVPNIYVRWHGHGLPEGARVRVKWVAEDVGDLVEPNFVVDETETVASTPNGGARFTLGRPPDGWAEGKYRVEFYVDGDLTETVGVTIGK